MGSTTLMLFTDRVFLGRYSVDALAAATPASVTAFMFMAFFLGVVTYVNTFISQYTGSGNTERIGALLWQAIYFSCIAGIFLALIGFVGKPLFVLGGHPSHIQKLEVSYFTVLILGSGLTLVRDGLACFYSGRGITKTVMIVNMIGAAINIPLDYAMINGVWGFPEWGITGAGIATVCGNATTLIIFGFLTFTRNNNRDYGVFRHYHFDGALFKSLLRFGTPAGVQFFIDIFALAFFIFIVGQLGTVALAATNIALAINMLAFLPMLGFSIAISILVGQAVGRKQSHEGAEVTTSALHITFVYMSLIALIFVCFPEWLIDLFKPSSHSTHDYAEVRLTTIRLLRFVAIYTLFEALTLVYSATIKGAGDTRFVGWTITIMSTVFLMIPVSLAILVWGAGIYISWSIAMLYICLVALVFRWRYRQGKWKKMRLI
ncbi:MAG: MATE family efflux transporter [Kiritimatiellae bacterium]|nr:MATE family efflux transporter [Kiritimatiellia bacterium]